MVFGRRRKKGARCYVVAESPVEGPAPKTVTTAGGARARLAGRSRNRIAMCALVFFAAYGLLGLRLAYISLGGVDLGGAVFVSTPQDAARPEIVDRNGVILATNLPMTALEVAGREVWDADETAAALATLFPEIDAPSLAEKLAEGRYVEVLSDITPAQQQAAFNLGLPGVKFSAGSRRFYPQEALAAHVVGHVEPGRGGVMGLERVLNGRAGIGPLVASIDLRVQQALEDELQRALEEFSALAAWGAVMDARSGEVIALASYPDFDPNAPGAAPADWRRNRATYDRYELGSAFKPLTAAAAFEAGAATEESVYDARGTYRIADRRISDYRGENRVLSFSEVVQHSSNIGAARMAADLGVARQKAALKALGLFEPLPIELAENRPPQLPMKWGPVESATVSYGHGISVTPLHLLAAFTAVVNGGEYRAPTFVKAEAPREGRAVFSPETSIVLRRVLRRVVTGGSAKSAEAPGYFPIGKTSTAEKPRDGRYDRSARIASFFGAFPGYAPRYTIMISLDDPQPTDKTHGFATAGWNAAPAASRLTARIAPGLGVMPVDEMTALSAFFGASPLQSAALEAAVPTGGGAR